MTKFRLPHRCITALTPLLLTLGLFSSGISLAAKEATNIPRESLRVTPTAKTPSKKLTPVPMVKELYVTFKTGDDDLREGSSVSMRIYYGTTATQTEGKSTQCRGQPRGWECVLRYGRSLCRKCSGDGSSRCGGWTHLDGVDCSGVRTQSRNKSRSPHIYIPHINQHQKIEANSTKSFRVRLPTPIPKKDIRSFKLQWHGGAAYSSIDSYDNWDVKSLSIKAYERKPLGLLAKRETFFRFTKEPLTAFRQVGNSVVVQKYVSPKPEDMGKITHLQLVIKTGDDDLKGGIHNLEADILYRGGGKQTIRYLNARQRWGNGETHVVKLPLNKPKERDHIVGVVLRMDKIHEAGSVINKDDWNIDYLRISWLPNSNPSRNYYYARRGHPLKRIRWPHEFTVRW